MLPPALTLSAQRLLESDSHCKVFPTAELHPKVKSPHAAFGLWPSVSCTPTMFSPSHSAIRHYFLKCCCISPKCSCLMHTYGSSSQRHCYQKLLPWQCWQGNLWVDWLGLLLVHSANSVYFQFLSRAKMWTCFKLPTSLLSAIYWLEGKSVTSVLCYMGFSCVKLLIGWTSLFFQMLLSHGLVVTLGNRNSEDLGFIAIST